MKSTATIFTDISLNHNTKVLGYAYYFVSDEGKRYQSRIVKDFDKGTYEAEAYAIVFAIRDVFRFYGEELQKVYVYCDNKGVVELFKKEEKHAGKDTFEGKLFDHLRKNYGNVVIDTRHIKAHQGINCKRSYLNDRVDKLSRKTQRNAQR